MHVDRAGTGVLPANGDHVFGQRQQYAGHRVLRVVGGRDGDCVTGREAGAGQDGRVVRQRVVIVGIGNGGFGRNHAELAVAVRLHARKPSLDQRIPVEQCRQRLRPADKPDTVKQREIGDRQFRPGHMLLAGGKLLLQPREGLVQHRRRLRQRHAQRVGVAAHGLAVGHEGLDLSRRQVRQHRLHAGRLHRVGHGGRKQRAVDPGSHDVRLRGLRHWIQRRIGRHAVQHRADQRRIAIDIGADLHDRRAAVTARERRDIGLGHDRRNFHRAPGQALGAQHEPDFLGKRRRCVLVKDEVGHLGLSGGDRGDRLLLNRADPAVL